MAGPLTSWCRDRRGAASRRWRPRSRTGWHSRSCRRTPSRRPCWDHCPRPTSRARAAWAASAMEVLFAVAAASPTGGVLEANFHRTPALPSIRELPGRSVEVFCRCPPGGGTGPLPGARGRSRRGPLRRRPRRRRPVAPRGERAGGGRVARRRGRHGSPGGHGRAAGPARRCGGPVMVDFFGGWIARNYDADTMMSDPAVVCPAVDFLAGLAADGTALELGSAPAASSCRSPGGAWRCTGSTCPRHGGAAAGGAGVRGDRRDAGRLLDDAVDGSFRLAYLI